MDTRIAERARQLREELKEHNRRYYVDNSPSISDYDYDMLMNELISIEKAHPELITEDSPTRNVGSDLGDTPVREFARVQHRYPMLSLGNTYNLGEVEDFALRASKATDKPFTYCCELKFDGTAICLLYRKGRLVQALTRGDGTYGDDVTANVRKIKNIPHSLKGDFPEEFEIRGEIYMPYADFDRLCREREIGGEEAFANPRNAASGSLKLLDPEEVAHRGLECTLYHMPVPYGCATHDEALSKAASWGLPVSGHRRLCRDIGEIESFINSWDGERKHLPFATDGVVIKINELDVQGELGYTSKSPRWAVAYKFKAEQACTPVLSIDYQVGRTGAVTPVANLAPVELSGTTVQRATLHNQEQMRLLDIRVGDWVYVEKGGEIIPKITAVELSKRPPGAEVPRFPDKCPDCGTPLVREEDQAKWFCPNYTSCPTQAKERLVQFLSRKAMNVLEVGDSAVGQMYDKGLVRKPSDLYYLKYEQLYALEGWKDKSCTNFFNSLEKSKSVGFEHVLFALGIRNVGETTAKTLARHFRSIDALASASGQTLQEVKDIGGIIADSILAFFADEDNRREIERLRQAGVRMSLDESAEAADNILGGASVVISGNFSISREQMKELIEKHGGKPSSSISSKTLYLVAGTAAGPEKLKKAAELGTSILTEEAFYEICNEKVGKNPEKELTLFD